MLVFDLICYFEWVRGNRLGYRLALIVWLRDSRTFRKKTRCHIGTRRVLTIPFVLLFQFKRTISSAKAFLKIISNKFPHKITTWLLCTRSLLKNIHELMSFSHRDCVKTFDSVDRIMFYNIFERHLVLNNIHIKVGVSRGGNFFYFFYLLCCQWHWQIHSFCSRPLFFAKWRFYNSFLSLECRIKCVRFLDTRNF